MKFHTVVLATILALAVAAPSESGEAEAEAEYGGMGKAKCALHSEWFIWDRL